MASSNSMILFKKKNCSIVNLFSFRENSQRLCAQLSSSQSSSLLILDIESGKTVIDHEFSADFSITGVAISNAYTIVVAFENGWIRAFSEPKSERLKKIWEFRHEGVTTCSSISINCDGTVLAAGVHFGSSTKNSEDDDDDIDHAILFFDLQSNPPSLMKTYKDCHSDAINCLTFDPSDPDLLFSGGSDGLVNIFDLKQPDEDDALQFTFNCVSSVSKIGSFALDAKAALYALTDDGKLFAWSTNDGDDLCFMEKPEVIFASSNELFLVDCFQQNNRHSPAFILGSTSDGLLTIARLNAKENEGAPVVSEVSIGHADMIRCLIWSSSSNRLITGGDDGIIACTDLSDYFGDEPVKKRARSK